MANITQPANLTPPPALLLCTLSLRSRGSSFGWSTLIAGGHSLSTELQTRRDEKTGGRGRRREVSEKENPNPTLHQSGQAWNPGEWPSVSFLIFFPSLILTNICPYPSTFSDSILGRAAAAAAAAAEVPLERVWMPLAAAGAPAPHWLTRWLHNKLQHPRASVTPAPGQGIVG